MARRRRGADLGILLRRARERTSAQADPLFEDVALRIYSKADALGEFLGTPLAIVYTPPWPVVHLLAADVMER